MHITSLGRVIGGVMIYFVAQINRFVHGCESGFKLFCLHPGSIHTKTRTKRRFSYENNKNSNSKIQKSKIKYLILNSTMLKADIFLVKEKSKVY